VEHSLFCLLKNPSEQAEQRAYELWNRHSRAPSPAHKKAANTEGVFFCLLDKNKGRDSLPEIRDGTSWDGGRNTTRLPNFAKPHEERAKAIIGNQRNPKGQRIWGYWGQILSCFSPKQSVFFFFVFAEFCSSSANSTNFAIFWEKISQSFRCYKIEKNPPLGIWATYFDFISMYTQTPNLNVYSNSMVSDSITICSSR